jgi:hypothetical protein
MALYQRKNNICPSVGALCAAAHPRERRSCQTKQPSGPLGKIRANSVIATDRRPPLHRSARVAKAALDERHSEPSGLDFGREFNRRSILAQSWNTQERLHAGDPAGQQIDLRLITKDGVAGCEAGPQRISHLSRAESGADGCEGKIAWTRVRDLDRLLRLAILRCAQRHNFTALRALDASFSLCADRTMGFQIPV